MGVEHSAQHLCGLVYAALHVAKGYLSAYPAGWCWEPWPISPFSRFAPSKAEGRTCIPQLLKKHPSPLSPQFLSLNPYIFFTSASCIEEWVDTLGLKSYPSSLRPNLSLAYPGIHGQNGLARSNTGSETCVQYALSDQGPEGAGSWSHLGRAMLTSAWPLRGPGKAPLGDEALPVGCYTQTISWTVFGHRLWRLCSVPQEIPYTNSPQALLKREPVYRFSSHIQGHLSQSCGAVIH